MKRRTHFSDPDPGNIPEKRTSKPTSGEAALVEKFDPLSPNKVEDVAGVIVRTAVDIARYRRSIDSNPEHYTRLERVAQHFASVRVAHACIERVGFVNELTAAIDSIDWQSAPDVLRPQVTVTVPYSGTELGPASVLFINQPSIERTSLPA